MAGAGYTSVFETPGICGGYPRIANTRISMRVIIQCIRAGVDLDGLLTMYPQLSVETRQQMLNLFL